MIDASIPRIRRAERIEIPEELTDPALEAALMGSLIAKPSLIDRLPDSFRPEHLSETNQTVWVAVSQFSSQDSLALLQIQQTLGNSVDAKYLAGLLRHMVGTDPSIIRTYAESITNRWARRKLYQIGEHIKRQALAGDLNASAASIQGGALTALEAITTPSHGRGPLTFNAAMDGALEAAEEAARRGSSIIGLPTGMPSVDEAMGGMEPGCVIFLGARPGMGKAQPLDAKILRADGTWTRMGDLRIGDALASVDGAPSRVMAIHPRGERKTFTVTLSDGRSTVACADHLWRVMHHTWASPRTVTTLKLREMLTRTRYQKRLSIDRVSGHFGSGSLPLDPYVLGVLLGDGCLRGSTPRITCPDLEVIAEVRARLGETHEVRRVVGSYAYSVTSGGLVKNAVGKFESAAIMPGVIAGLGLARISSEAKYVPQSYLSASRQDRLDLLRGLMDTDGWAEKHGSVRFASCSLALAEDVQTLVRSLGGLCSIKSKRAFFTARGERKEGMTSWVCRIRHSNAEEFFLLKRKSDRAVRCRNAVSLTVRGVEPAGVQEVRCITVTHTSSLYVTDGYTVTHNSALGVQWAIGAARHLVKTAVETATTTPGVLVISLEMMAEQLGRRSLSAEACVPSALLRRGQHQPYLDQLMRARRDLWDLPIDIEDASGQTLAMIRSKCRAAARRHGGNLGLIVVDHLHIVGPDGSDKRATETEFVGRVSNGMKLIAKDFGCPALVLCQLNRKLEDREDKRPMLADLRQSGNIEQDADVVAFLFREEYYLPDRPLERLTDETDERYSNRCSAYARKRSLADGKAELILAKVREGQPNKTIALRFDGATTSFHDDWRGAEEF